MPILSNKELFKRYFLSYVKLFCVFILTMYILFCPANQVNVLQKVIKDWTLEVYLLILEPVLDSCWLNHWKWFVPDTMPGFLFFCQTVSLDCFLQPKVLLRVSKITVTYPVLVKMNIWGQFRLAQSLKNGYKFWTPWSQKKYQFHNL